MNFSVIVPAYNEQENLPSTIEAIQKAMDFCQNRNRDFTAEIIVVDNNSTDRTAEIAKNRGAKVVWEEKRQIARSRNSGGKIATGDFLLFCDADSHIHPETLLKISEMMKNENFIGGGIKIVPDEMNRINRFGLFFWEIISEIFQISGGTLFCRKNVFEALDGFSEKYYIGEEVNFQMKMKFYALRHKKKTALLPGIHVVTSMRKIREYGLLSYGWAVLRCFFFPWLATKRKYCSLWYDVRSSSIPNKNAMPSVKSEKNSL